MLPLTQDEVFRQIKQKAKRKQHKKTAFTSGVVTKLLKDLYNPDLRGSLFFSRTAMVIVGASSLQPRRATRSWDNVLFKIIVLVTLTKGPALLVFIFVVFVLEDLYVFLFTCVSILSY